MESQKIIAIVNEKGGTCKTTTSVNLAAALGEVGKQVLLVDLDGQAASSRWVGVEEDNRLAEAMCRGKGLEPIRDVLPGVSLAPASGKLDSVAHDLRPTQGGQLRKVLGELSGFDFILIDCPPSLGNRLIGNALLAATHVLVPVETSILALDGLKILLTTLDDVREGFDHKIVLAGVLACRFDPRTRLSRLVLAELQRALPGKVFATVIRENVKMRECPASGQSILTFADDSHAAADYRALAKEIIDSPQIWLEASDGSVAAQNAMGEAVSSLRTNAAAAVRQAAGMDAVSVPATSSVVLVISPALAAEPVAASPAAFGGAGSETSSVPAVPQDSPLASATTAAASSEALPAPISPPASIAADAPATAVSSAVPVAPGDFQPGVPCQQPAKELEEELARLCEAQQHLLSEVESPQEEETQVPVSVAQPAAAGSAPVPDALSATEQPAASPMVASPIRERFPAISKLAAAPVLHGSGANLDPQRGAVSPAADSQIAQPRFTPVNQQAVHAPFPVAGPSGPGTLPSEQPGSDLPQVAGDSGDQGEKKPDYPALREYMRQMAEAGRLPGVAAPVAKQAKESKVSPWRRLFQKGA